MDIIRKKYSELHGIKTVAIMADPACRAGWEKNFPPLLDHVWRKHKPELFIVAGDLAVYGTPKEFEDTIDVMKPYPARLAAVPGDHDRPLKTFMRYFGSTRKIVDAGNWRFIGINTAGRKFPKTESDFLEKNLRPNSLIFSHLPPGVDGWTFHSFRQPDSDRFLSIIDRHAPKIRAAFFGHIHGYSRRTRSGVPLIVTGAVAESLVVRNNCYNCTGFYQMMIFDTATGKLSLCRMG
jgi:predicted phosphodiesterase